MRLSQTNRLAIVLGAPILLLMMVDGFLQPSHSGAEWASGAANATALFMVGLVCGTLLGILGFFACLVRREKLALQEQDQIDSLLEEVSLTLEAEERKVSGSPLREGYEEYPTEDPKSERLDPWERSSDWWKGDDDKR